VGSVISSRMKFLGRVRDMQVTVTEFAPDSRFSTEGMTPYRWTVLWTFTPENTGTRVVRAGHIAFRGVMRFISPILIRPLARRTDQASLERLKRLLETRRAT
jgi:hypothetical protein